MFVVEDQARWSASDLSVAAECEYQLLCRLDVLLGRSTPNQAPADPLLEHVARLGDRHEQEALEQLRSTREVRSMARVQPPYTEASLRAAADLTRRRLAGDAVLYQPAFYDGEFFGYADFLIPTGEGWQVWDAKLAREARPRALLQLGAYVDQLAAMQAPVAPTVGLLLGNREPREFKAAEVLPVFAERRTRLRVLLTAHRAADGPVRWGRPDLVACGRCADCRAAIAATDDLWATAGVFSRQRTVLRDNGIRTMRDLAEAVAPPAGLSADAFDRIQSQARLQVAQREGDHVLWQLREGAAAALAELPPPSPGDLFFDFEGDPLYDEGDPAIVGLEYLWGILDAAERFDPWWALDRREERAVFIRFVDYLTARREQFPDLHVYHYAPYETSALKRLAIRYQTREDELDDLLRAGVFVDLYAVVRAAVRVGQPSYSIKKLEPLYMGERLRDVDGVTAGDASIVAFHEYRQRLADGDEDGALRVRRDLADYNGYDCLSTLRLRDWLLARAAETGVSLRPGAIKAEPLDADSTAAEGDLHSRLMAGAGPLDPAARRPDEQARALLAAALAYYRREQKVYWWAHIDALDQPVEELAQIRDVFLIESASVEQDWRLPTARTRKPQRVLRLTGEWTPGSQVKDQCSVFYLAPGVPGADFPSAGRTVLRSGSARVQPAAGHAAVLLTEACPAGQEFDALPVALYAPPPPRSGIIEDRIALVAATAVQDPMPEGAVHDLLTRRPSRLRDGAALHRTGDDVHDIVASLLDMSDSYVAVQGPPGTGKTYTACRVIAALLQHHHWRIGIVGQSHAVVENLLTSLIDLGVDRAAVGKAANHTDQVPWTDTSNDGVRKEFLARANGFVLGGTAWTFCARAVPPASLDLLVIEEAGQFSLAATIGAGAAAARLLLVGDPQQLPQVSQARHPEPVDQSALGWLMGQADTIAPEQGYFLATSHRMHPQLCRRVSALSYEGRLTSAPAAAQRSLTGVEPGVQVVVRPHVGNSVASPQEADEVVRQVRRFLGAAWREGPQADPRPLAEADVLVVAPYNAQVELIRSYLVEAGFEQIQVGTVDRFQGREAPVVIVSMTASSHGDVPRGMGFLLSRNRINVAISRAQWCALIVRSEALSTYLPADADSFLELGAFLSLGDQAALSSVATAPMGRGTEDSGFGLLPSRQP